MAQKAKSNFGLEANEALMLEQESDESGAQTNVHRGVLLSGQTND